MPFPQNMEFGGPFPPNAISPKRELINWVTRYVRIWDIFATQVVYYQSLLPLVLDPSNPIIWGKFGEKTLNWKKFVMKTIPVCVMCGSNNYYHLFVWWYQLVWVKLYILNVRGTILDQNQSVKLVHPIRPAVSLNRNYSQGLKSNKHYILALSR